MKKSDYEPVLFDGLVAAAREAIDSITKELIAADPARQSFSQLCDHALLFAYRYQAEPRGNWRHRAIEYLDLAVERISSCLNPSISLFGGLAGAGWVFEHLSQLLGDCVDPDIGSEEDPIGDIDLKILHDLDHISAHTPPGLINGFVGLGVYFLERLPGTAACRGLHLVVDQLEKQSVLCWGGTTWHTPSRLLSKEYQEVWPSGYYDLGVGHGVPGMVQFFGELITSGLEVERAQRLMRGAVQWLLAQERCPDAVSRYSSWFVPGMKPIDSPLAWYYGDLGIAATLHHAACQVGREDWRRYAKILMDRSLARPMESGSIEGISLCYGVFGIAHVCNRMYQVESDERYKDIANSWYERGLALRLTHHGTDGRSAVNSGKKIELAMDQSFLTGTVGIALALLAAIYPIEPQWDRLLLLSGCLRG